MFHIYGILVLNVSILSGSLVVIMNKFSFPGFCQLIQDYKIDTTYVAPPIILALAKSTETKKYNLSHLVYINSAAAPLSSELQVETEQKLGVFVTQGYGMSEAGPLVSRSSSGSIYSGSVGPVCSNTEVMFLDKNNIPVGVNQVGELCVKGPQIMIGYYKNKEATDEAIQSDGYLHTGDMGYIDSAGNIYITDRKKELIKYKGFQIPPAELEGLLTEHPAVVDAAVIPIYDDTRVSEIPKAFVVLQPGITASDAVQDICNWLAERVADYKRLRGGIEVIDAIPRSATGKILRRVLKDLESERRKQHTLI
ncbi:hypothetical protein LPJ73_008215 [Coemansia sp. RSA 2703]|nr:hypothetical protein LPJ73_008215 [Coemansia sp. RSA 2703]